MLANQSFAYKSSYRFWLFFCCITMGLFVLYGFYGLYRDGFESDLIFGIAFVFALFFTMTSVFIAFVRQKQLQLYDDYFDFPNIVAFYKFGSAYSFLPAGFRLSFNQIRQLKKINIMIGWTGSMYGPGYSFVGDHFKVCTHDVFQDGDKFYQAIVDQVSSQADLKQDNESKIKSDELYDDDQPVKKFYGTARWLLQYYALSSIFHVFVVFMFLAL